MSEVIWVLLRFVRDHEDFELICDALTSLTRVNDKPENIEDLLG